MTSYKFFKPETSMTTHHFTTKRLIMAAISVILSVTRVPAASDTKNGIALYVKASKNTGNKTTVTCRIVNESAHKLLWGMLKSGGCGFQIKLYDAEGKLLPQEKRWAEDNAQEGTWNIAHPRGISGSVADPAQVVTDSEFDLEDAYGNLAAQGRKLVVSWRGAQQWWVKDKNGNAQPTDENGNLVVPPQVAFDFTYDWKLKATVPLPPPEGTGDATAPPGTDPPPANPPSVQPPPAALPESPPTKSQAGDVTAATGWWWALLAIPLLLLAWLGLRLRKTR